MSNFLKGKLSYASSSKPKRTRNVEHSSVLQSKENDYIYESILRGMNGGEKEYISDLIKCKRKREGRSSHIRNVDDDSAEDNFNQVTKQPVLRMNSPKLKHVQSLDEVEFLDEQSGSTKYKSTNTSFVFTEKLLDKKERQNSERKLKRNRKGTTSSAASTATSTSWRAWKCPRSGRAAISTRTTTKTTRRSTSTWPRPTWSK